MKLKSNLTKRYYFPIVEGSNFGYVAKQDAKIFGYSEELNSFVTYFVNKFDKVVKVTNYSQQWHWLAKGAVEFRKGYHMSKWSGTQIAVAELAKANKYLNHQYNRIDKHLEKGEIDRAVAVWRILHTRSKLWTMVLFVRKIPFMSLRVEKARKLLKTINKLMKSESYDLKMNRVFLPEYNDDGSLKKHRPLGVPSLEWRVIAASYEFLLVNVWAESWAPNQFACMPGKGTVDAWLEILRKISQGKVDEIIGYDLAKFFDLVYTANLKWMLEGLPEFLLDYFNQLVRSSPKIKEEEKPLETDRLEKAVKERLSNWDKTWRNPILPPFQKHVEGWNHDYSAEAYEGLGTFREAPYQSFPQGVNTSPVMCCRALQDTGVLNNPNVYQYVDDGVIINSIGSKRTTLEEFKKGLYTEYTGIALSGVKTESIMEKGQFLKPLKFLGCTFDGNTLRGHSRRNGPHEAVDAERRTIDIIKRLKSFPDAYAEPISPGAIKTFNKIKKDLAILIAESSDPSFHRRSAANKILPATQQQLDELNKPQALTWWEQTNIKVEVLHWDSIEAQMVARLPKTGDVSGNDYNSFGRVTESSNTATMMGSYFILNYLKRDAKKIKGSKLEDDKVKIFEDFLTTHQVELARGFAPSKWIIPDELNMEKIREEKITRLNKASTNEFKGFKERHMLKHGNKILPFPPGSYDRTLLSDEMKLLNALKSKWGEELISETIIEQNQTVERYHYTNLYHTEEGKTILNNMYKLVEEQRWKTDPHLAFNLALQKRFEETKNKSEFITHRTYRWIAQL